ncbi:hypothetical protein M3P21_19620 [Ruegeria sp. 2012CJ41-6]|uniref:Uncharacterized protein n=1 Tax=Ruegeria spongiae TaxID=2942209 RepID=A0ABT0Q7G6_9RHOB|nr:hypothetical protein [Ruegeria spongiae]MCL6285742.1 hypothetical protein [Ruegeria spongiae]
MPWSKNWVRVCKGQLYLGGEFRANPVDPIVFIQVMRQSRSLRTLKDAYPATARQLISALEQFGFDFTELLRQQFEEQKTDAQLAKIHAMDAKCIARIRADLQVPAIQGRPSLVTTREQVIEAYRKHKSYAGAARELGLDQRTFGKRYRAAVLQR